MIFARQRTRMKAGLASVLLYAFCVLAPSAATALQASSAIPCLTHTQQTVSFHESEMAAHKGTGGMHSHANAGGSAGHDEQKKIPQHGNCCGMLCLTALSQDVPGVSFVFIEFTVPAPLSDTEIAGIKPQPIPRPPIA